MTFFGPPGKRGPRCPASPALAGDFFANKGRICVFILLLSLLCPLGAWAGEFSTLAASGAWLRLLHYEADRSTLSGFRSAIHSPEFFLAENGPIQPEAELQASLAAMLEPLLDNADQHAKCRFPARLIWLRQQFPDKREQLAEIACPGFAEWGDPGNVESLSLVFANGYLGNPASYYGHTFLKFNHRKSAKRSRLLDLTVNYGAIIDGHDDPVSYIVKGVTGGYDGGFSQIEYYFHDSTYGENELRDLWEYRLDLPKEALRLIVAHAWEVMKKRYVYFFFRHNCSYRVAELLEVVEGLAIIPQNTPWLIPQALVQQVATTSLNGHPLVAETHFHPSRQTRLYAKYSALNGEGKSLVNQIVGQNMAPSDLVDRDLPLAQKQSVLDALLDYYQFNLERGKKEGSYKSSPEYEAALAVRLQLPPGSSESASPASTSPDRGRAPSWVQLSVSHSRLYGNAALLRIRPAYYDMLDAGSSQVKNGALSMGDLQLKIDDERLSVRKFDLLSINSMNPALTGLPGDRGFGWKFKVGAEQERISCESCLVTRAQGDVGIGRQLDAKMFASIHVGGALQQYTDYYGAGFARVSANLIFRPEERIGFLFAHEERMSLRINRQRDRINSLEGRLAMGKNADLRLSWENDGRSRFSVGWGAYW